MYFCYLDESGTAIDPQTKSFVLVGVAIPATLWKRLDSQITASKIPYGLQSAEIHTAWMLRRYSEQEKIPGFLEMTRDDRTKAVNSARKGNLLQCAAITPGKLQGLQKTYRKTNAYVHLTLDERRAAVADVAKVFAHSTDARLFGQVINKKHFAAMHHLADHMFEYTFERVVSRFEAFLHYRANWASHQATPHADDDHIGLLIQDNNPTVASKLTQLMRKFHKTGTHMRQIDRIVETPLFVDSELTCMVQVADICAYAVRRFIDNGENTLFNIIHSRIDRAGAAVVGLRHFANNACTCRICREYRAAQPLIVVPPTPTNPPVV